MPTVKQAAAEFLANKRIAVTGVSRNPRGATAATSSTGGSGSAAMRSLPSIPTPTAWRATAATTIWVRSPGWRRW